MLEVENASIKSPNLFDIHADDEWTETFQQRHIFKLWLFRKITQYESVLLTFGYLRGIIDCSGTSYAHVVTGLLGLFTPCSPTADIPGGHAVTPAPIRHIPTFEWKSHIIWVGYIMRRRYDGPVNEKTTAQVLEECLGVALGVVETSKEKWIRVSYLSPPLPFKGAASSLSILMKSGSGRRTGRVDFRNREGI